MSDVGFIGLGTMGAPMAGHLQKGGHTLYVHTRSAVPEDVKAGGATLCLNAKEVAQHAEIIFTMVPDTPDVDVVLFGAGGVAEGLSPGKVVVDMSSISPIETKGLCATHQRAGLPVPGRTSLRRPGRRQGRVSDHHGRR